MSHRKGAQAADSKAGKAVRDRSKSYMKFGAFAAGSKLSKAFPGDPENPSRMRRAGRRVSDTYYRARARDRAIQESLEARKQAKDMEIAEHAAQMGAGAVRDDGTRAPTVFSQVGGTRYSEIMGAKIDEAFNKRVESIKKSIDQRPPVVGGDVKLLGDELASAIRGGDAEKTAALIGYLSSARGAPGREMLESVIQETAGDVENQSAVHVAINNAINRDNYSTLVSKAGGLAKGNYQVVKDARGAEKLVYNTNLSGVSREQLATQDWQSLYKNFETISKSEAQAILNNPELFSSIGDDRVEYLLKEAAANTSRSALIDYDELKNITDHSYRETPAGGTEPPSGA